MRRYNEHLSRIRQLQPEIVHLEKKKLRNRKPVRHEIQQNTTITVGVPGAPPKALSLKMPVSQPLDRIRAEYN